MNRKILTFLLTACVLGACAPQGTQPLSPSQTLPPQVSRTADPTIQSSAEPTPTTPAIILTPAPRVSVLAEGLDTPWEIVFLPGGDLLVTERFGQLTRLAPDGSVADVPGVSETGEGGLLGLALDPDFASSGLLYFYLTSDSGGSWENRVERYYYDGHSLSERTVILDGIRGAANHDGGRLEFGPDGYLYITTGDAGDEQSAQDPESLNGKILRIAADGSIPVDNPFGNAVWSLGHRNPQGLAWDDQGNLWSTEHGPSGLSSGFDELNRIVPGGNYGWPVVYGDEAREGMIAPVLQSGADETWAPGDLEFFEGRLFFSGLRGETLYAVDLQDGQVSGLSRYFEGEYGRLRALRLGEDGLLYLGTSNRDGRGDPYPEDDRILRVNPDLL